MHTSYIVRTTLSLTIQRNQMTFYPYSDPGTSMERRIRISCSAQRLHINSTDFR